MFIYTKNNPLNLVDPNGLEDQGTDIRAYYKSLQNNQIKENVDYRGTSGAWGAC